MEMLAYPRAPIRPESTRVGWIGAGVMGAAMAARILAAGYPLTVYARTPSKAHALVAAGAELADSPAAAARSSDVLFTMVSNPSDVRSVALDPSAGALAALPAGALAALPAGAVLVDCTSSDPALAVEISAAAASRGCCAVDAPVSGGDTGARNGTLAIFAGGDEATIKWLSPVLELLGNVTFMGPAGSGQSSKIANQIAIGGTLLGLSEALVFVEMSRLDKGKFLEAVKGGAAGSRAMELFGERIVNRELGPGGFAEFMVKDLRMGLDGGGNGDVVVLPGAALCRQLYLGMVANGDGKRLGTHGLVTVVERLNAMEKKEDGGEGSAGRG